MNKHRLPLIAYCMLLLALQPACTSTIAPKPVASHQASFDDGGQNSGILQLADDGSAIITPRASARYEALIATYGRAFTPPIAAGFGLSALPDGTARISPAGLEKWLIMATWQRMGRAAP